MKKKQPTPSNSPEIVYANIDDLKGAEYNPRKISDAKFRALCQGIVEFGFVEPIVARKEDKLVIGGHQRIAALRALLSRQYVAKDRKGNELPFSLPDGVPVVFVGGLSDTQAKKLNLALNNVQGEWDFERLSDMLDELRIDVDGDIDALLATGFTAADFDSIVAPIDAADIDAAIDSGTGPKNMTQTPKLQLEFSSSAQRDILKAFVVSVMAAQPGVLSGDTMIAKLGLGS